MAIKFLKIGKTKFVTKGSDYKIEKSRAYKEQIKKTNKKILEYVRNIKNTVK